MSAIPEVLARLLESDEPERKEEAWGAFVRQFSRLIHLAARKSAQEYDDVMDRYAYVLERLRENDCGRLRRFEAEGRSSFGTWLVVVSGRLCVDFHRRKYGRSTPANPDGEHRLLRRRLADLVSEPVELELVADAQAREPDLQVRRNQLGALLSEALEALSHEERLLLRLRFDDGRSAREIARLLGLSSEFVVHRRLKSLLGRLRDALVERGVHEPAP